MSSKESRARRRSRARSRLLRPIALGGALLLLVAVVGIVLLGPLVTGDAARVAAGTNNGKGLASAPVEVEEWSDFQ